MSNSYQIIRRYYGDRRAKRSGVLYMNHIDEGIRILNLIRSSPDAIDAYCLHPLVQKDEDLAANHTLLRNVDSLVVVAVMEYRRVANNFLLNNQVKLELSPLESVNDMLIADKIQNRKDFELYHLGKHPRSDELDEYLKKWFKVLDITEAFYKMTIRLL